MKFPETPDSAVTRAAYDIAAAYESPALLNHSLRSFGFAAAYGEARGVEYDQELLYVASMLHDLALTAPFDNHTLAFEDAGGHLARVFAAGAGWPEERRDRMAAVIVLHMRDDVPASQDAESHLLQIGVSADVSGQRLDVFGELADELLERHPRQGFGPAFVRLLEDQAARKPDCAAAVLVKQGIAARIAGNPLES